jgi:hypothetical protein
MKTAIPTLERSAGSADAGGGGRQYQGAQATHREGRSDFIPLFNGTDLKGWNGKPGWWKVEDGALTAESTPEKPCKECNYLIWRGDHPSDFELLLDFKLSSKANSGIQIRSRELLNWDCFGYQADMTGDGSLAGFVYHHQYGLIAGRGEQATIAADGKRTVENLGDPAELLKHFKPDEWNNYHVICRGPEITISMNGVLMCQITDHRVTKETSRGIIALQMHPGPPMKVQFKNIRMKPFGPSRSEWNAARNWCDWGGSRNRFLRLCPSGNPHQDMAGPPRGGAQATAIFLHYEALYSHSEP